MYRSYFIVLLCHTRYLIVLKSRTRITKINVNVFIIFEEIGFFINIFPMLRHFFKFILYYTTKFYFRNLYPIVKFIVRIYNRAFNIFPPKILFKKSTLDIIYFLEKVLNQFVQSYGRLRCVFFFFLFNNIIIDGIAIKKPGGGGNDNHNWLITRYNKYDCDDEKIIIALLRFDEMHTVQRRCG